MKISDSKKELIRSILTRDGKEIYENVENEKKAAKIIRDKVFANVYPQEVNGKTMFFILSHSPIARVGYLNPEKRRIEYYSDGKHEDIPYSTSDREVIKYVLNHFKYPEKMRKLFWFNPYDKNDDGRGIYGPVPLKAFYDKAKKILETNL